MEAGMLLLTIIHGMKMQLKRYAYSFHNDLFHISNLSGRNWSSASHKHTTVVFVDISHQQLLLLPPAISTRARESLNMREASVAIKVLAGKLK